MSATAIERRALLQMFGMASASMLALPVFRTAAMAAGASAIPVRTIALSANTIRVFDELLAKQGFLEEFNVMPTAEVVADGSKVVAALVGGASDICMQVGFGQFLPAIAAGARLKVIAGAGLLPQVAVYTSRPDITSVAQLEGCTIGTGAPGTLLHSLMVALFEKKGVDTSKVKFVNVGSSSDVFRAITAGKVDAGPGDLAFFDQQDKYHVHALTDGQLWVELPEYTNQVSVTTETAIDEKRDVMVRMLAAYVKLYRFLHSPQSHDPFVSAFKSALGSTEEEANTQWRFYEKYHPFDEALVISPERVNYMQDLNVKVGLQKSRLDYAQVVDMSLAQEALKLVASRT